MDATGLLQAVRLMQVSWCRARGCCWLTGWLLEANFLVLPMLGRFSLLKGASVEPYSEEVVLLVVEAAAADGKATASNAACTGQ